MAKVLIVDDETLFRESLADGLVALDPSLEVVTAENGRVACEILQGGTVDLVLTDLQMPEMDGFELLGHLMAFHPEVPVLVMTAFGDRDIGRRLREVGLDGFIEKPADFDQLSAQVARTLDSAMRGTVRGISLPTFLQALEIDRKTCTVRVCAGTERGTLCFVGGEVYDAELGDLRGEQAVATIVCLAEPVIELLPPRRRVIRRVHASLTHLLLTAFQAADEQRGSSLQPAAGLEAARTFTKEDAMSVQEKLKELAAIEGFAGAGVFTPTGENLALFAPQGAFNKEIGVLANAVLMNAQRASLEMGSGRGQQVHVTAEHAHILVRCLNEGNDPLKSEPGKAHIHMVMVLSDDSQIGLAKMRLSSTIEKIAPELRS